jgi:biotin transport system substrate-specific component
MVSQAVIPLWINKRANQAWAEFAVVVLGSFYLAVLAQVSIPLPFTPVPITGQTFGVATLALLWGSKRAFAGFGLYLIEGAIGLPVFAQLKSGMSLGPTAGYLVGMWVACIVVGGVADRGLAKSFKGAFLACVLGSICVFTFGLIGLSFFVPTDHLLESGVLPFLPGDLLKNSLAAGLASAASRSSDRA